MTVVIDAITHQLNSAHIADQLNQLFSSGLTSAQIVCEAYRAHSLPGTIRVSLSQLFNREGVAKQDRFGLRCSEPFPFTFEDRPGRFYCIHIDVYRSKQKAMLRAVSDALEGVRL